MLHGNLKGRHYSEKLGIGGRKILKCFLEKESSE
jgi:hypothetical protein